MKNFAIMFLLLVVPVAIRCEPLFGGGGLGGTTNPLAGLMKSYLDNLTGTNGILKGQGLSNLITQLLSNLMGNSGSLTGLITGAGKNAEGVQNLITNLLNVLLGPNGLLSILLGPGGPLSGAGTNVISGLLNTLLGPTGLVPRLLGPNGLLGGLLNSILGPNGLLGGLLNGILERQSGGGLLSGILGPNGLLAYLLGTGSYSNLNTLTNAAMCQLQGMFPGQDLSSVESNCLSQVLIPYLASAIQSFLNNPACNGLMNVGNLISIPNTNLQNFMTCVENGINAAG